MKPYEPVVEFCIKIIDNGEIYYEEGIIDGIPENFSKREAIAQLQRICRDKKWYLADIVYLIFPYWHNGIQYTRCWIDVEDFY